jgi:hypothetical protein
MQKTISRLDFGVKQFGGSWKLACALFAFGWLPWQSPGRAHDALRVSSAVLGVHGENDTGNEHAQLEQPPLRFGEDELPDIHCADLHSFLFMPIAVPWPRLCLFLAHGRADSALSEIGNGHLIGMHLTAVIPPIPHCSQAQHGCCMRATIICGSSGPVLCGCDCDWCLARSFRLRPCLKNRRDLSAAHIVCGLTVYYSARSTPYAVRFRCAAEIVGRSS